MDGIFAAQQSRKEMEWRQRLDRFAASGEQIKSFCKAESVSEATFYRWRKQLVATSGTATVAGFIDVGVMPPAPVAPSMPQCASSGVALEVRLDLGCGLVLQIVRR